jgi:integrase
MEAAGNCAEHVSKTCSRIRRVLEDCKFTFIPDLSDEEVARFLHRRRLIPARPPLASDQEWYTRCELAEALGGRRPQQLGRILRREGLTARGNGKARRYPREAVERLQEIVCRGMGVSTSNAYATAIKSFCKWLVAKKRTGHDRMAGLAKVNAEADRRHERRALLLDEIRSLLDTTHAGASAVEGLAGRDRALLYAVAMASGFRASELRSMHPASFDLDADPPTATVKAAYSKNRRESVQPLPPDLAAALRTYLEGRPARQPVWPGDWHLNAAEMLRHDLALAGIPCRDDAGRVVDFHALRHSYITLLSKAGVSPKVAQELARHSTIDLTMNVYTHVNMHDLAGAVAGLPPLVPSGPARDDLALAATGTDGRRAHGGQDPIRDPARPRLTVQLTGRNEAGCDSLRASDTPAAAGIRTGNPDKPLHGQGFETRGDRMTLNEGKLPGQDSNLDKESQNHRAPRRNAIPTNTIGQITHPGCSAGRSDQEAEGGIADADLAALVAAWPMLPEPIKAAVRALVTSAVSSARVGVASE